MTKPKRFYTLFSLLLVTVTILSLLGVFYYNKTKSLETALKNSYTQAFHDMTDYLTDIDISLKKMQLADDTVQLFSLSSHLYMQTEAAKACFAQLPQNDDGYARVSKFLSQAGDYSLSLARSTAAGGTVSKEDLQTVATLSKSAADLSSGFSNTSDEVFYQSLRLSATPLGVPLVSARSEDSPADTLPQEYPTLIYDGPFSQHLENRSPELIKEKPSISVKRAEDLAYSFLPGKQGIHLSGAGESHGDIEAYQFTDSENGIDMELSKQGGEVLWFLKNRRVEKSALSTDNATTAALEFLDSRGYTGFEQRYFDVSDHIATINFAYVQNDVTMYADLIKVQVALDNGEILGFEGRGYVMCHKERTLPAPKLTPEDARALCGDHLSVESVSMACIPLAGLREVLCYEIKGSINGSNFLVYINAENGQKENILLLEESEHGILTV